MKTIELTSIEREMQNFDFNKLTAQSQTAKANIAKATSAADVTAAICGVWSSISKYVKAGEILPFVGKYLTILADLLDSICSGQNG
ncbi:MAG: hypothetical protein M3N14_01880 [Bacteroidota bacterium]|nr:hypothetical protein [Bacteroidota bacterium]